MSPSVVICGGGTGGHVTPGLAVAKELCKQGVEVAWLGVCGGIEERLVPNEGLMLRTVDFRAPAAGVLGYADCLLRLSGAVGSAKKILRDMQAQVMLGLGGYPSLPGLIAGRWLGCRCLLHEQNVLPGLANRVMALWMHRLLTSNPLTFAKHDPIITGNPVRAEFAAMDKPSTRAASRNAKLRLLVLGGSSGARSLNEGVPVALALLERQWTVAHACGHGNYDTTTKAYAAAGVEAEVVEYMNDISVRMAAADLVVCRAGASTVAELSCVGVAAVIVPYPYARRHQDANAALLSDIDAARVLDDSKLADPRILANILNELGEREELVRMAKLAVSLGRPTAASEVASACIEELGHAT